jgi:integrase
MKKINYASLYTLRKDGRYMGYWHDKEGRHAIYDRDPESLYNRIQEKENHAPEPLTFEQAAKAWEAKHWDYVGEKTIETYAAPLRRVMDQYGEMLAEEVTAQSVQAFLADLARKGYAKRTVQMHRDILNMIFNNAIIEYGLRFNPCSAVSLPRNLPSRKRELPNDGAIEAVKNGLESPFGLFAYFCLYSGLRRGELLALRYEDINRESREICVDKAVEYVGNNPRIKSPKTAAGVRVVPLLDPLAAALPKKEKGLVFGNDDGRPLTKEQYKKRWAKYCKTIGHDITAHQLRHGYATILYEAGVPDKDAQELLGHSNITLTRDVYTHIRSLRKQETAKKLNDFVVSSAVNNS